MSSLQALERRVAALRDHYESMQPLPDDQAEQLEAWQNDASVFATDALGLDADEDLAAFMRSDAPEVLELAARQTGKTTKFAAKATHKALFTPGTLALIVSATQRQAGILQRTVTRFLRHLRRDRPWRVVGEVDVMQPRGWLYEHARLVRCSVLSLELANGSEVVSVPASPDTVRGYAPTLILIDEAAWVPDAVYEVVRPMRAVTKAQLIVGSSAGYENGWFWREWMEQEEGEGWLKRTIRADECPRVTAEFLARERRKLRLAVYEREYENAFMPAEGTLLTAEVVRDMFTPAVTRIQWPESNGVVSGEVEAIRRG